MRHVCFRRSLLFLLALVLLPAASARGTVSLRFTDSDTTPTAGNAIRGSVFTITLELVSTSERTTGVDYFLRAPGAGSGFFRISDRVIPAASPYNDPQQPDSVVEEPSSALLDPQNDHPLGAGVTNVNSSTAAGTFTVASYTLSVLPTTPLGTYTIESFSLPGEGYIGPAPAFTEAPFNNHASYSVTVVPEPTTAAMAFLGVVGLGFARRPRPRRAVGH